MTSNEIRQSFLDFFKSKGHTIVLSSSLMPDSPNLLFTNAGMNQFVPIFLGQQPCPFQPPRAADAQKCIRAGGKHNDLEDVGLDTYHHTFFEMLGNWSFGDYFKKEAIDCAWELITEIWKLPKNRLYATVYCPDKSQGDPSEFDQEAYDCWAEKFARAGLDPRVHIRNGNKKDNFWMMGETGPCGPCSEIHMDLTPEGNTRGEWVNAGSPQCIEIWNLVFMQFNANPDGTFSPLPARSVDTGMGFERVTSIIQCTKNFADFTAIISNYETDIFRSLFDKLEQLSGRKYSSTLPDRDKPSPKDLAGKAGTPEWDRAWDALRKKQEQIKVDIAFRIIADHIRALSFSIADGIQPGNTDRNYVLRRILRRAVRYGRTLGFHEPFFFKLVGVLADTMGDIFAEIRAKQKHIEEVIRVEEEAFNKTLDRGIEIFNETVNRVFKPGTDMLEKLGPKLLAASGDAAAKRQVVCENASDVGAFLEAIQPGHLVFPAAEAFKLYDTYGFPLDLTELMARERGLSVDTDGFNQLMEKQKSRARAAQKKTVIELSQIETTTPTNFVGYDKLETPARVLEVVSLKNKTAVVLDTSSCYAEMGGQVGDTGELSHGSALWRVVNTQKNGNTWLHLLETADAPEIDTEVRLSVDAGRRFAIQRHHTVTHLLHWALHKVVSRDVAQKGSFVGPDKLTFDFNSAPLTPQQVADVEKLVNERIVENAGVFPAEVPYPAIKNRAEVRQFFGEKYGDTVRVIQIGGQPGQLDGYSMELCGGTHARATGEIGLFRIVSEAAIAAGVRRIEAIAGLCAYQKARQEAELLSTVAGKVNTPPLELEKKIDNLLLHQKELEKVLKSMQQKQAAEIARSLAAQPETIGTCKAIIKNLGDVDGEFLQAVVDTLKSHFKGVAVLGGTSNDSVVLVATVSPEFTKQIQAGKIIQTIAPLVGGKGGGRPDFARGGGKDIRKLDQALHQAKSLLAG
jgi:alanyl-tRNA synthetase